MKTVILASMLFLSITNAFAGSYVCEGQYDQTNVAARFSFEFNKTIKVIFDGQTYEGLKEMRPAVATEAISRTVSFQNAFYADVSYMRLTLPTQAGRSFKAILYFKYSTEEGDKDEATLQANCRQI